MKKQVPLMYTRILFSAMVLLGMLFTSCEHTNGGNGNVNIVFSAEYKGEPFAIGSIYNDDMGHRIRIDNFMSYFSMLSIIAPDGSEKLVKDFALINFANGAQFTLEVEAGAYNGINFNLGIPKEYNKDVDPTTYANSHPLSVQGSQGMFWHWNTGYIFTKFEGKADTTGVEGTELLHPFAFHVGDDPMFRQHASEDFSFNVSTGETKTIHIIIDVEKIMKGDNDPIDLASDYITHTTGNTELATRFMNNFNDAIRIE